MLLALLFFVLETFIPSHGALTLAAVVAFVLGTLLLFDPAGDAYQVSLPLSLAIAGTLGAFMLLVVAKLIQIRRRPVEVGVHSLVGEHGTVRGDGLVFVNGELWHAHRADGEELELGGDVAVEGVVEDGLELIVAPAPRSRPKPPPRLDGRPPRLDRDRRDARLLDRLVGEARGRGRAARRLPDGTRAPRGRRTGHGAHDPVRRSRGPRSGRRRRGA